MKATFKNAGVVVPAPLFKAILMSLAERDETADVCTDNKGNPEPDPDLRDKRERILLAGDVPSPLDPPSGCHFHPRCGYAVDECARRAPSLDPADTDHACACPVAPFKDKPSRAALVE